MNHIHYVVAKSQSDNLLTPDGKLRETDISTLP